MSVVIDFIVNNPELTAIVAAAVESVVMPFVPVKWNGFASFLFGAIRKKLPKGK